MKHTLHIRGRRCYIVIIWIQLIVSDNIAFKVTKATALIQKCKTVG